MMHFSVAKHFEQEAGSEDGSQDDSESGSDKNTEDEEEDQSLGEVEGGSGS